MLKDHVMRGLDPRTHAVPFPQAAPIWHRLAGSSRRSLRSRRRVDERVKPAMTK
jgi:hypothetical protein